MLTRAQAERVIVDRCGRFMSKAGMAVTYAGANADLTDPLRRAARDCGGTVAASPALDDADLATVAAAREDELLDRAELRTLLTIHRRLTQVSTTVEGISVSTSDLARQVEASIRLATEHVRASYGLAGAGGVGGGFASLGWAAHPDDDAE